MADGREFVRGVNLGNWLVLEKWMHPLLFEGSEAEDEQFFATWTAPERLASRMRQHRGSYVTQRDFALLAAQGIGVLRIPVPWFIRGDRGPFVPCLAELDRAFAWAEHFGQRILIDLHTAPFSQNGFDNGGICGVCRWAQKPEEVEYVLVLLEQLAARYAQRPGLWGVGVLNEPISEQLWTHLQAARRYPPHDPAMAEGSSHVPLDFLQDFYREAYARLRRILPDGACIVVHDNFRIDAWDDFVAERDWPGLVLDTHFYFMGLPPELDGLEGYRTSCRAIGEHIARLDRHVPVVVGEWCLSNSAALAEGLDEAARRAIYREVAQLQLDAWARGSGWFYWSYKLLFDSVSDPARRGLEAWDYGYVRACGWLEHEADHHVAERD